MILTFHSIYYLFKFLLRNYKRFRFLKQKSQSLAVQDSCSGSLLFRDAEDKLSFDPPVYIQRYSAVQQILLDHRWKRYIKKVVDFGCAECAMFTYLKHLLTIEKVVFVDIMEELLREKAYMLSPLTVDYLKRRVNPLVIEVLAGSVASPDVHLLHSDAIIAIELIEHLYPDTLDAVPYNIFAFIQPKIAIFTTPNADFNVIFPNPKKFRHSDHKFEWTREQFESWAVNITHRFPQYSVYFQGIGCGPKGTENVGACSQMAVFIRSKYAYNWHKKPRSLTSTSSLEEECQCFENYSREQYQCYESYGICTYHSYSKQMYEYESSAMCNVDDISQYENCYYRLIKRIEYPFEIERRSADEIILNELLYSVHLLGRVNGRYYSEEQERSEIPVVNIVSHLHGVITSTAEASSLLQKAGYRIEECVNAFTKELELCVIYEPEMETQSSSSHTEASDYCGENDWESMAETDAHSWNMSDLQTWGNEQPIENKFEAQNNVGNVLHEVMRNVDKSFPPLDRPHSSTKSSDWNTDETGTSNDNRTKCDSEFSSSCPEQNFDLGTSKLEPYLKLEHKSETSSSIHTTVLQNEDVSLHLLQSEKKKGLPKKVGECLDWKESENKGLFKTVKEAEVCKKIAYSTNDENHIKKGKLKESNDLNKRGPPFKEVEDVIIAGGSNIKRRKKQRKNSSDESCGKEQLNFKEEDDFDKNDQAIRADGLDQENGLFNEILLEQIPPAVVENGDLVNNNRDYEGNNYPDAPENIEEYGDADNENQNRVENAEEDRLIEDNHNQNGNAGELAQQLNDAENVQEIEDVDEPVEEFLEVEHASREALFDPNSQIDLLEGFFSISSTESNRESNPQSRQEELVVIGINQVDEENGVVLPPQANPFPNWLLHLLENEEVGNFNLHDEPHFYCQGDGIGVHPSIIEVDLDDDSSESESEDSTRNSSNIDDNLTLHTSSNSQSDMLSFLQDSDSQNQAALRLLGNQNPVVISNEVRTQQAEQASPSGARGSSGPINEQKNEQKSRDPSQKFSDLSKGHGNAKDETPVSNDCKSGGNGGESSGQGGFCSSFPTQEEEYAASLANSERSAEIPQMPVPECGGQLLTRSQEEGNKVKRSDVSDPT